MAQTIKCAGQWGEWVEIKIKMLANLLWMEEGSVGQTFMQLSRKDYDLEVEEFSDK